MAKFRVKIGGGYKAVPRKERPSTDPKKYVYPRIKLAKTNSKKTS